MADEHFNQLKVDVGLVNTIDCTTEESKQFAETEKNGNSLPNDIFRTENGQYVRLVPKVSSDKEELYVLMRLSKDVRFFKILAIIGIVLACAAVVIGLLAAG